MIAVRSPFSSLIGLVLILGLLLSGCMANNDQEIRPDDEREPDDPEPIVTKETGSITGMVVNDGLEYLVGATVRLVDDAAGGTTLQEKTSDEEGRFTINDIEPGPYRLLVTAHCCHQEIERINVVAGEVEEVNVILERLPAADLKKAYSIGPLDETYMIDCLVVHLPCTTNKQQLSDCYSVEPGLKTAHVALEWSPVGGGIGGPSELEFRVELCAGPTGSLIYKKATGTSPIEFRLDAAEFAGKNGEFPEDSGMSLRVVFTPPIPTPLVYQQSVTVWRTMHYWEPAPTVFSTIPEG